MKLFNYDSPVMDTLGMLWDMVQVNLLFIVGCIPVITIGASMKAAYAVIFSLNKDEGGSIFSRFKRHYLEGIKKSIIAGVIMLIIGALLYIDFKLLWNPQYSINIIIYIVSGIAGLIYMLAVIYTFPLLSMYENTLINTIKNSIRIGCMFPLNSLIMILLYLLPIVLASQFPIVFLATILLWLLFGFAIIFWICSKIITKQLKKISEMQK